jgi:type I restriction enzyme, S subunit
MLATSKRKLKFVATINDEALGEDTDADFEMRYIDISNVDSSGRIGDIATYRFEDAPSRARRRVRDGDVIISTVRTYLQAIAQITRPPANLIASTGFAVVRPRPDKFDARYCNYALREPAFLTEVERRSVGVSYPAINASDLASIPIHIHPLAKQRAIADYLDRETAQIDALIAAKKNVLELLAEKRRALITRAVTRGLDSHVPMKETTSDWLPLAPKHWMPTRVGRLFRQVKRQGFPDEMILSVYRDYGVIERASRDDNANRVPEDLEKYQLVNPDDLVINKMKAWQGSLGISSLRGITSPDYIVYAPEHKEESDFLHLLLRNSLLTTAYLSMSNGIRTNQWRLEPERFENLQLFMPPVQEQRAIVLRVGQEAAHIDRMLSATERTIALLAERRAGVIAAAVAGRIDVEAKA